MSLFCSIDKSTSGSILSKITFRQLSAVISSFEATSNLRRMFALRRQSSNGLGLKPVSLETLFINALVRAGRCREHTLRGATPHISNAILQRRCRPFPGQELGHIVLGRRYQGTSSIAQPMQELSTREELLALVDQYDGESFTDRLPLLELPSLHSPEPGHHLFVSDKVEDSELPSPRYKWPAQGEARKSIKALEIALEDPKTSPEYSYRLYRALPAPRIPYLDSKTRHNLLRNLGVVERKDEESMLRYLSVVDDMKAVGIPLTTYEWNCATSFAGRYVGWTTEIEVEAGLRLWKEMEHVAGVKANAATFNILFDMATKAGKFKLAEMIYDEMKNRGHAFNRFHHVSLIHYYGIRADGEGVRKAYKALVEAGEIVDTIVLNCMISSLFRAYEPQAAEQVYERMKMLHKHRSGAELPPRDYKKRREVTKTLMRMTEHAKRTPAMLKRFQNQSIIAPDVQTYRILIQYLAVHAGELNKTVMLLDDMRWFEVPLNGSIFFALFKGFALHGGIRYSHWTQDRLESVWRAYMQAIERQDEDLYIGKWMVTWVLKAYAKCSGRARTIEIWDEIKERWKAQDEELDFINNLLQSLAWD